ncbi:MAG: NnrS family protein, partial [Gammaproteobacteria bacterium]
GLNLALLFGVWVLARITFLLGEEWIVAAAGLDMIFSVALVTAVTYPVVKSRQWKQMAIVSKLLIITGFNACFYLGIFGLLENGVSLGVFGGFYMVIGLVLTLGRRVIPFFIERGVGYQVQLINSKWLDISSLVLYLGFFLAEVLFNYSRVAAVLALGLLAVNAIRLIGWHTRGIWKNPMLWILYLSMWFICLGFLFFGLSALVGMSKYIALHAFAFGGIGLVTMGMMVRVSLAHTGRSVTQTPMMVKAAFGAILLGAVVRVLFPLIDIDRYSLWLVASQILWIAAFAFFLWSFLPILLNPRIDED